ncbi:MAG: hypothetical protein PHU21_04240 [Elusimicrobia bacterium]|nr:hypothetical protein [Elusimicrobiota bacterium]
MKGLGCAAWLLLAPALAAAQIPDDQGAGAIPALPAELPKVLSVRSLSVPLLEPMVYAGSGTARAAGAVPVSQSTAARAAMVDEARKIFVELRFRLAPYDSATGIDKSRYWKRADGWGLEDKAQDRTAITVAASRAPGPGLLAAPLFDYDLQRLEDLTAVDADGRQYPAKPWGLPRQGNAVWFQAEGFKSAPLPAWREAKDLGSGFCARLREDYAQDREKPDLRLDLNAWQSERKPWAAQGSSFRRKPADSRESQPRIDDEIGLVFDSSGTWRGWLADYDSPRPISPAALRDEAVAWEEFRGRCRAAEARARRALPLIHLRFQPDPQEPYAILLSGSEERKLNERFDVGFPLASRVVFSPRSLSAGLLGRLVSVELLLNGKARPARLAGVLRRGVAGYLVVPEQDLESLAAARAPEEGALALAVEPYAVGPAMQVWAYPDRLEGTAAGYDGTLRPKPRFLQAVGGLLADLDGRPFGLAVEEIRQESVVEADSWHKPSPLVRLHPLEELARAFAEPETVVDPRLKPPDTAGGKRRAWLGAGTQDMTADLAKLLGVSGPTRGGAVGQLVAEVEPGSPSARAGLKPGDVLLRLREAGKRQDAWLPAGARSTLPPAANPAVEFFRRPATGLDDVLAQLAPGTSARLTYARGGRERGVDLVLQESPPDFESPRKLTDRGTGLSLRELTPDVRRLLRLKDDFQGLLVYDVEPGSPARVAGLRPFGLLVEVDGRGVSALGAFASLLAERRRAGAAAVRVRSLYLGRPLYADLRIAPDAAAP